MLTQLPLDLDAFLNASLHLAMRRKMQGNTRLPPFASLLAGLPVA